MLTVVHITADDMLDSLSPAQRRTAVAVTTEHGNYAAFLFNADDLGPIKMWLAQRGWLSGNLELASEPQGNVGKHGIERAHPQGDARGGAA
jgi:hypothetical protein